MLNAKEQTNCPNCGAPITSEKCPYCGTVFYDFSCIDIGSPSYIKLKYNGRIVMCKAFVREATISIEPKFVNYQPLGGMPRELKVAERASVSIEFDVISDDGVLFTAVKEE